ncbi:MAG TPA: PAS domain S-box protein [Ignavibacteria bacterium]|jgi:PAS domain S-box-containing protein
MKAQLFSSTVEWNTLLNSINDPIFILNKKYYIVWCNSKAIDVYGYSGEEFLNMHINDLRAPYSQSEVERFLSSSIKAIDSIFEIRHVKKNGELFPVQISTRSLEVEDELFYIHAVRDITVRVKAEDELKKSEKKYKDLVEFSPIGIYVNVEGKIVFANKIAISLFGAEGNEDVIGKSIFEFLHPDYYKIFAYRVNLLRTGMTVPILEARTLGLDGSSLIVEVTAKPINYFGKSGVEVFMHDITIRKKAEERINLLASVVESCDDAIIAKDITGRILYWNKGAENLYGYKAEEIVGKSIANIVPPDSLNEVNGIMEIIKKGGHINHYNTFRRKKDGILIRVSVKISPILDVKGEVIGASSIAYKP